MKFRISLSLLAFALAVLSPLAAHATGCNNSTIKGTYAFSIHGQIFPPDGSAPLLVNGIAKTTFDGDGNLNQVDAVAINGGLAPGWRPGTGSYSINSDCTGTMTVVNENMPPLDLQIVVAQSGNTLHAVVIDPGFAVAAEAERLRVPKSK